MALKIVFNPLSNQFDYIDTVTGGSIGSEYKVDKRTLSALEISNKSITLDEIPTDTTDARMVVIGGIEQEYGIDFTIAGDVLSWNGLGLDGLLAVGDKIVVIYN